MKKDNKRKIKRQDFIGELCYTSPMDFSRPDNARKINRIKVLNALRKGNLSRAELSRELVINKVSISEITDALIKEGLIESGEKDNTTSGRPSTKLGIARTKGRVFSFVISSATVTASASNLMGQVLRFERFPKDENMLSTVSSFVKKMIADNPTVYGVTIISNNRDELPSSFFPWPVIYSSLVEAQSRAEMETEKKEKRLYISWGDIIEGAYQEKFLHYIPSFGHMKVASGIRCKCGCDGCLDAVASGTRLKEMTGITQYRRLTSEEKGLIAIDDVSSYLAFALSEAVQALGAESVVLTGEMAAIPDDLCASISDKLRSSIPLTREVKVTKAIRGDKATLEGAGIIALDRFFYHSDILEKLNDLQSEF